MKVSSIRFRLIVWFASLLSVVVLAFGAYTYERSWHYQEQVLSRFLANRARLVEALVLNIPSHGEPWMVQQIAERFSPESNDRFVRIMRDGVKIYGSGPPNDHSFEPAEVPLLDFSVSTPVVRRQSLPTDSDLLIASRKVEIDSHWYTIEVGSSLASSYRVLHGLGWTLACGLPVVVGLAILGGMIILKRALLPVERLMTSAQEITLHQLDRRLPVPQSGDEIAALATALNQMIGRLDEAFRNSSRFTSDASHELRTPLTIIRGELEALSLRSDVPEEVGESIGNLLEETERLVRIVEGLFALARLDSGESQARRERFDLSQLAETTAEQICMLAEEKRIVLRCETAGKTEIDGDRARIKQVIVNLLDNAIKYTPPEGHVIVSVGVRDGLAFLEVNDSGSGIPDSAIPYIFERFYRADEVHSREVDGAGLGLSIVHSICTAHGGSVSVRNTEPSGCCFTVLLPCTS